MKLSELIRATSKKVSPSHYFRVHSKEHLLQTIQAGSRRKDLFFLMQKLIATSLGLILFFGLVIRLVPPQAVKAYVAEAKVLEGSLILEKAGLEPFTITSNTGITVGDKLTVPKNSKVQVDFIDTSSTILAAETVVTVDAFLVNPQDVKKSYVSLRIDEGNLTGSVEKADSEASQVKIQTPSGIIEASSSDFTINVNKKGETDVTVLKNALTVKAIDTKTQQPTKQILAQAQPVAGYSVKIAKEPGNSPTAFTITPQTNDTKENQPESDKPETGSDNNGGVIAATLQDNTNGSANQNSNEAAAAIPQDLDPEVYKTITGHLEIASVKLNQAIRFLNERDTDQALAALKDYNLKIVTVYNLLTGESRPTDTNKKELSTILIDTITGEALTQADKRITDDRQRAMIALIKNLYIIEQSVKEKIVVDSVSIVSSPDNENGSDILVSPGNDNNNAVPADTNENVNAPDGNENTNAVSTSETPKTGVKSDPFTLPATYRFEVSQIVELAQLQSNLTEEKRTELEGVISNSVYRLSVYLGEIEDWKTQQTATKAILSEMPNNLVLGTTLEKMRSLFPDRVSHLVTAKIRGLK